MRSADEHLAPLQDLLDSILTRLCAVEGKVGIDGGASSPLAAGGPAAAAGDDAGPHPALVAYDEHVSRTVEPFAASCDAIGLGDVGTHVRGTWAGIRSIVELGSKSKRPSGDAAAALTPHLKPVQESVTKIRTARLDRKYDWHIKAITELLSVASWPVVSPPSMPTPTAFVKEAVGSSDFWSNKIRKEYKGKDDDASKAHIAFCDNMKKLILDLAAYVKEHHLSGLMWNSRGVDLADAAAAASAPAAAPKPTAAKPAAGGGGIGNMMAELSKKKNSDGTSAATGLKRVTKDQQTWRKEFNKEAAGKPAAGVGAAAATKKAPAAKSAAPKRGPPVMEYRDRGFKWAVENHTKDTAPAGGVLDVEVSDAKQQVYVYRCEGVTVRIKGKVKNVVLDECTKVSCLFETAISACELVNCKNMQIQATGTCPSFSIDKTDGCLIYISKEAVATSNIVTSKSSEMNVSWEDESGEVKEAPIPEQFQHKLVGGAVKSDVSDLYH